VGSTSRSVLISLISFVSPCGRYEFDMGVVFHCFSTKLNLTCLVRLKRVNKISLFDKGILRANDITHSFIQYKAANVLDI